MRPAIVTVSTAWIAVVLCYLVGIGKPDWNVLIASGGTLAIVMREVLAVFQDT